MLTQDRLREILYYHPDSGDFVWKEHRGAQRVLKRTIVGTLAGVWDHRRYLCITISSKRYYAHRLAWFYVHGRWPEPGIDHINGDKSDNRICNLREASQAQNGWNMRSPPSKLGVKGVRAKRQKYEASISINGKLYYIGTYASLADAVRMRRLAEDAWHGEFAHGH